MTIITKIIAFAIIILLSWQYAIPLIDATIKRPSDYITDALFNDNADGEFLLILLDKTRNIKTPLTDISGISLYAWKYYPYEYDLLLQHNLKPNLFGEFTTLFRLVIQDKNGTISPEFPMGNRIAGYMPLISNQILVNQNFTINYENQFTSCLSFRLYNQDGILMRYKDTDLTTVSVQLQGKLNNPTPVTGAIYNN